MSGEDQKTCTYTDSTVVFCLHRKSISISLCFTVSVVPNEGLAGLVPAKTSFDTSPAKPSFGLTMMNFIRLVFAWHSPVNFSVLSKLLCFVKLQLNITTTFFFYVGWLVINNKTFQSGDDNRIISHKQPAPAEFNSLVIFIANSLAMLEERMSLLHSFLFSYISLEITTEIEIDCVGHKILSHASKVGSPLNSPTQYQLPNKDTSRETLACQWTSLGTN